MSVITKNCSDNGSLSCGTNPGSGTPLATPEPKTNSRTTINSRIDFHYPNFQNPPRIYENNVKNSKLFRILTVLTYMVAVSMAAIILSIYYTFIWNPYEKLSNKFNIGNISKESVSLPQMPLYIVENKNQMQPIPIQYLPVHYSNVVDVDPTYLSANHKLPAPTSQVLTSTFLTPSLYSNPSASPLITSHRKQSKFSPTKHSMITPIALLMISNGTTLSKTKSDSGVTVNATELVQNRSSDLVSQLTVPTKPSPPASSPHQ